MEEGERDEGGRDEWRERERDGGRGEEGKGKGQKNCPKTGRFLAKTSQL